MIKIYLRSNNNSPDSRYGSNQRFRTNPSEIKKIPVLQKIKTDRDSLITKDEDSIEKIDDDYSTLNKLDRSVETVVTNEKSKDEIQKKDEENTKLKDENK